MYYLWCICIIFWCNMSTFEHFIYLNIALQGKYWKKFIWITVPNIYTTTFWNNRSEYYICYYHFLLFIKKKKQFSEILLCWIWATGLLLPVWKIFWWPIWELQFPRLWKVIQILLLVLDLAQVIVHSKVLFLTCTELGLVLINFCFLII